MEQLVGDTERVGGDDVGQPHPLSTGYINPSWSVPCVQTTQTGGANYFGDRAEYANTAYRAQVIVDGEPLDNAQYADRIERLERTVQRLLISINSIREDMYSRTTTSPS